MDCFVALLLAMKAVDVVGVAISHMRKVFGLIDFPTIPMG
jgi:hypothetical protein